MCSGGLWASMHPVGDEGAQKAPLEPQNLDFLILGLERLYASHARASSGTGYAVRVLRSQR